MQKTLEILSIAHKQPVMQEQLYLLQEREQLIPGSVQYVIRRFKKTPLTNIEETAMMVYHFKKDEPKENYLELRFCITGNTYCRQKDTECNFCKNSHSTTCEEKIDTVDVVSFKFSPAHLSQFVKAIKNIFFIGLFFYK